MGYQLAENIYYHSEIGVILPTFGEADNIAQLIEDIETLALDLSILVIDDSSSDGTAQIVEEKQTKYHNLFLCSRPKKSRQTHESFL
jgi:dolichol-phosphate mannosyltransferase